MRYITRGGASPQEGVGTLGEPHRAAGSRLPPQARCSRYCGGAPSVARIGLQKPKWRTGSPVA